MEPLKGHLKTIYKIIKHKQTNRSIEESSLKLISISISLLPNRKFLLVLKVHFKPCLPVVVYRFGIYWRLIILENSPTCMEVSWSVVKKSWMIELIRTFRRKILYFFTAFKLTFDLIRLIYIAHQMWIEVMLKPKE